MYIVYIKRNFIIKSLCSLFEIALKRNGLDSDHGFFMWKINGHLKEKSLYYMQNERKFLK